MSEIGILKTSCISRGKFFPEEHKAVLADEVQRVKTPLKAESILMSRMNTPSLVGEVGYVQHNQPDIFLPDRLWMFSGKEGISDTLFLSHLLSSDAFRQKLSDIASGTSGSMKNIPQRSFLQIPVQLPPLPEQNNIAEILSGIDRQILSIKSVILQAEKIRIAISKELIGSISDELVPLSEVIINHDSRRMPIKSEERALRRGPYRYFGASGVIDTIDDFLFDGCYILVGEDGANIIDRNKPLAFKVSGRFWVNNHAHVIQPRESCDVNFLTYYLESLDYAGVASGSAQPKITRAALDAIQVPLPPLEIQRKIGAAIESTVEVVVSAEKKEERLIVLKQALSADLLSGRKRVTL